MQRRARMPFVIEVKRGKRRFTQSGAGPGVSDRKPGVWSTSPGAGWLIATPFNESGERDEGRERSGPTVDAARIAADRMFVTHAYPAAAPAHSAPDLEPRNLVSGHHPAPRNGLLVPGPAADTFACEPDLNARAAKPRTGRILQSLATEDPVDALLRQKAEELAARRHLPRGPRVASATRAEAGRTIPSDGQHDAVPCPEPQPPSKPIRRKKKKVARTSRRSATARRPENDRASAKPSAPKGAVRKTSGKKVGARKPLLKGAVAKMGPVSKKARKTSGRRSHAMSSVKLKKSTEKTRSKRIASRKH